MIQEIMWKRHPEVPIMISTSGHCFSLVSGKIVGSKTKRGYIRIKHKKKLIFVHRAVATVFIENPKKLEQVNHKDLNKENNSVENLEWCTLQENLKHSWDNGKKRIGSSHGAALFSEQQVFEIKNLKPYFYCRELAVFYGVSKSTIKAICNGQNWGHVKKDDNRFSLPLPLCELVLLVKEGLCGQQIAPKRKNDPGLSLSVSMDEFRLLLKQKLAEKIK